MSIPTFKQCEVEAQQGRVTKRTSTCGNFVIFNYAPDVEFKNTWNDVNMWCRGLIFDTNTQKVAAVPFKKFWNVGQKPFLQPDALAARGMPCALQDKFDGSLGIMFWDKYADQIRVSTRGSLDSEQAQWATETANLHRASGDWGALARELLEGVTYLVEIIYAENRIVVKYDFAGLVLLDVIDNATGASYLASGRLHQSFFPRNWRRADVSAPETIDQLISRAAGLPGMQEGYVVTYADGLKVKIKGAEYIRLHRVRLDLTPKRIFELLSQHTDRQKMHDAVHNLLVAIPDEFADPVRDVTSTLVERYINCRENIEWHYETARLEYRNERKAMANYAKTMLQSVELAPFFALCDERQDQFDKLAWRCVQFQDLQI